MNAEIPSLEKAEPGSTRSSILHVSADFPDPISSDKTEVIQSLVDLTSAQFSHRVISLNRRTPPALRFSSSLLQGFGRPVLQVESQDFSYGEALIYFAPPKGLFHATMLRQLGNWMAEHICTATAPDMLIGHKLSVEGIAVRHVAQRIGRPYAILIQGDTDTKILKNRPDLAPLLRNVFHEAAVVWALTPWSLEVLSRRLGVRTGPTFVMPCPTELDQSVTPRVGGNGLLSVFHLKSHRRKNLKALAGALEILSHERPDTQLAIVGGGSAKDIAAARASAKNAPGMVFEGSLPRSAMQERMNAATGFVLPSRRESFGLVFVEALFAGLPIIYPAGHSVDGYFENCPFAIRVDPRDYLALASAMRRLIDDEAQLKASLASWMASGEGEKFRRTAIMRQFSHGLELGLSCHERRDHLPPLT